MLRNADGGGGVTFSRKKRGWVGPANNASKTNFLKKKSVIIIIISLFV